MLFGRHPRFATLVREVRNTSRPATVDHLVPRIRLYTTEWCGFCVRARALLERRGLAYDEVSLDDDPAFRQTVFDLGRRWTVPLVVIDGEPIGGYEELLALDRPGCWPRGSLPNDPGVAVDRLRQR